MGWARAKECRLREVNRQMDRFVIDLKLAHELHEIPLQPYLLGGSDAHALLQKWVPDAVSRVLE